MEILLAVAPPCRNGVSDFTGRILTRRAHVLVVFLLAAGITHADGVTVVPAGGIA